MFDVVEREHRVEHHEAGLVAVAERLVESHGRFEPFGRVVVEIADRTAGETRQIRHERRRELRHQSTQHVDERFAALGAHAGLLDRRFARPSAQHEEWILAEEGVTADVFAAFHAFEQERVVGMLRDFQERGDRREQVGHDLAADGHEGAALGQLDELFERCLLHIKFAVGTDDDDHFTPPRNSSAPRSTAAVGASCPVHHSICRHA